LPPLLYFVHIQALRMRFLRWTGSITMAVGLSFAAGNAFAANGCAPGTFSTTLSPDGNATSFLFDNLSATSDRSQGARRATCAVSATPTATKGFSVFDVDYRGFAVTTDKQAVTLKAGKAGKAETLFAPKGGVNKDFQFSQRFGTVDSEDLDLSLLLTATGKPGDIDPAQIFLDSIDVSRIGFTTMESVTASLDGVAAQRRDLISRLNGASGQMLGAAEPFSGDDTVGTFTGTNGMTGFNARWNATEALTLLGGVALTTLGDATVDADNAFLFAGAARYAVPLDQSWKAFGEVGAWGTPDVSAGYSRSYLDGARLVSTTSYASGSLLAVYARMGVVYAPDSANEIALSARLTRAMLGVSAYSEQNDPGNLFAARLSGRTTSWDAADIALMWTHQLTPSLDTSLTLSAGQDFSNSDAVSADIDYVGKARGGWDARMFGSVGGRLGWQFHEGWSLDTTAQVDLREEADPSWNLGVQLKAKF
jgi:hypothetical protein